MRRIARNDVVEQGDEGPRALNAGRPVLLTVAEVARILRTTRAAVYAMRTRRQLPPAVEIGRRVLFSQDELLDWLDQKRASSPEEWR